MYTMKLPAILTHTESGRSKEGYHTSEKVGHKAGSPGRQPVSERGHCQEEDHTASRDHQTLHRYVRMSREDQFIVYRIFSHGAFKIASKWLRLLVTHT